MADILLIEKRRGVLTANVIFLHGLGGHPLLTWHASNAEEMFWPRWLAEDIEGHAIWSIGYEAPVSRWLGSAMHLVDRAENILGGLLAREEFREGRIILIGHSLGGLVIKQLLRTLESVAKKTSVAASLLGRVNKVAFLATPHTGSDLAGWGDRMRILVRPSAAMMSLVRNDPNLQDLNKWYREWANERGIHHLVLRETKPIRILGTIVKPDSSDPGLYHARAWATDTDHFSIAKPSNRDHEVYAHVKNFILENHEAPDIIDLKSGAEALKALTEALTNGIDAVHKYIDRRETADATKWTYVKEAGETATSLVIEHTKAVALTTGPARNEYGLDDTAILFRRLVDNLEFPVAYEKLHGQLEQLIEEPEIGKKAGPTIRKLRLRLIDFQTAAFMTVYSSWAVAKAVEWVAEAVRILKGTKPLPANAEARLVLLRGHLNQENAWWKFKYLPGRPMPEPDVVEPKTADEMVEYVQEWAKAWFEHVQKTLYERQGVIRVAEKLIMMGNLP